MGKGRRDESKRVDLRDVADCKQLKASNKHALVLGTSAPVSLSGSRSKRGVF